MKTTNRLDFRQLGVIFVERAYTGDGCHSPSTFATNVLKQELVGGVRRLAKLDAERKFGSLPAIVANSRKRKPEKDAFHETFLSLREMEKQNPVLQYFSPLTQVGKQITPTAAPTVAFQNHAWYPRSRQGSNVLDHAYVVLSPHGTHTGLHADTVTNPHSATNNSESVASDYKQGMRQFSDAGGVVLPREDAIDNTRSSKIFHSAPPEKFEEVRHKIIQVLRARQSKKLQVAFAKKATESKRSNLSPAEAVKGRRTMNHDTPPRGLTEEQEAFVSALENNQPQPLFRGAFCGPEFTIPEMKTLGFRCSHKATGGTFYLIPRRSWHCVLNDHFECTSYAWDCVYEVYNPSPRSRQSRRH
jgi:hypothetical protein